MSDPTTPRPTPVAPTSSPASDLEGPDRLAVLLAWIFPDRAPEKYGFHAGDLLIEEGESVEDRPALLIVEGEIEECVATYTAETGLGEHTVHVAQTGDIVNAQALVQPYDVEPSLCSLHANTDGWCYLIWRKHVDERPEVRAVLSVFFVKWAEAVERLRATSVESEELTARVKLLESGATGKMSASAVIDEWEAGKLTEAEQRLEQLQDELERTQVAVWEAKQRVEEAQRKLDLERRARGALEQRVLELMQRVADQPAPASDQKFPSAIRILESAELEEMEAEARRHRELAADYETRARMLHRAFEVLAEDNPGLVVKPKVMQLMMGEEPEADEEELARAARNPRATLPLISPGTTHAAVAPSIPQPAPLPTLGGHKGGPGKQGG